MGKHKVNRKFLDSMSKCEKVAHREHANGDDYFMRLLRQKSIFLVLVLMGCVSSNAVSLSLKILELKNFLLKNNASSKVVYEEDDVDLIKIDEIKLVNSSSLAFDFKDKIKKPSVRIQRAIVLYSLKLDLRGCAQVTIESQYLDGSSKIIR